MGMGDLDKPIGDFNPSQKLVDEMKKLLESPTSRYSYPPATSQKTDEIYKMLKELKEKIEKREETLRKISLLVLELYQRREINENAFQKLNLLLHEWTTKEFKG